MIVKRPYQYNWRNPKSKKNLHFMIACTMNLEKGTNQCNNNLMNWIFLCLYAHGLFFVGISYLFVRFGKIWCVIIIWHVIVFDVVIYPIYIIRFTFINIYNPKLTSFWKMLPRYQFIRISKSKIILIADT